jgi:serine phosphatase RsbU (regulator of sigma subunit)
MLPRAAPELPWVELASTTMPATEVGGDYFGYFPLDDQRLAIAIADVAGHGMASGLVLSGLRGGLHLLRDDMARPVEVLGRLDRMLRETSPGRMFVTLQIALLDAGRGELAVANAGHPPLLLLPAGGGEAVTIGAPGPPLGTRLAPGYVEVRHRLGAGDTVVLYTDGVAELRGPAGTALGEDGLLAEAARGARAPTAREVRDVLVGALARFKGDVEPADDLTMVIARITAAAVPDEDAIDSEEPLEPTGDPAALNPGSAATAGREER